jgi:hypothetical protein
LPDQLDSYRGQLDGKYSGKVRFDTEKQVALQKELMSIVRKAIELDKGDIITLDTFKVGGCFN